MRLPLSCGMTRLWHISPIFLLDIDPVCMTGRLTCHKQTNRIRTSVEHLMRFTGRDFESGACGKSKAVLLYFNGQLSLKNEEKLS